jgi:hypothetical protein
MPMAHCGLSNADARRGSAHAALDDQRVQRRQALAKRRGPRDGHTPVDGVHMARRLMHHRSAGAGRISGPDPRLFRHSGLARLDLPRLAHAPSIVPETAGQPSVLSRHRTRFGL